MKIEPGKFYRTRDQRKARIYAVEAEGKYPIHGAILTDNVWHADEWTKTGRSTAYHHEPLNCDLVSEWRDEPRVFWVNVYPEGCGTHSSRELADGHARYDRIERIRVVEALEEDA